MFGIITQEYNRIQSTVAFCLPKLTYSYAILRHLAHDSRRGWTRCHLMRRSVPRCLKKPFRLEDVQEHRLLISYRDQDTLPFHSNVTNSETLYQRISESPQPFDLDRLPADAEPYATIFSVHPRFGIDQREGVLKTPIHLPPPSLVDASLTVENQDHETVREEPDLPLYSDSLLLIDALERYEPTDLETMETL